MTFSRFMGFDVIVVPDNEPEAVAKFGKEVFDATRGDSSCMSGRIIYLNKRTLEVLKLMLADETEKQMKAGMK